MSRVDGSARGVRFSGIGADKRQFRPISWRDWSGSLIRKRLRSSLTGRGTRDRSAVLLGAPLCVPAAFLRGRVTLSLNAQLRMLPKRACNPHKPKTTLPRCWHRERDDTTEPVTRDVRQTSGVRLLLNACLFDNHRQNTEEKGHYTNRLPPRCGWTPWTVRFIWFSIEFVIWIRSKDLSIAR